MTHRADVLMITYRSAGYLHLSLPRLLETLGERDRVWLWHNGDDEATLETLRPYRDDPRVHRFHHSRENVRLREPTNWLWQESDATFVSKVDDDCRVSPGWLDTFAAAHAANPDLGVVGSWRHPEEDVDPQLAARKIVDLAGGHRLMRNLWVQGSGYLLRRELTHRHGGIREDEAFTRYCIRLARGGALNGFYYPFLPEDHMDDPRSEHTLIRTDADLLDRMPLSARANGVMTVTDWTAQLVRSAHVLQTASLDPRSYEGWRQRLTSVRRRTRRLIGQPARW
ncbi:glycosyltransferase family 2 protein [Georgenia satyanarayanai]|uniref:glycosyltransferase family 2 protein n=1 Tax=Georgenia satyanarayanai TaxID=860221 RepID=UPI00203D99D0|nr:glycosyltransferase family A protein [Georgenia satyanarayanai]MCM3660812.1 glycosyltransferase family 2 protein [Georgenia satyanarayanai]